MPPNDTENQKSLFIQGKNREKFFKKTFLQSIDKTKKR
jgi:hypothetical protein